MRLHIHEDSKHRAFLRRMQADRRRRQENRLQNEGEPKVVAVLPQESKTAAKSLFASLLGR